MRPDRSGQPLNLTADPFRDRDPTWYPIPDPDGGLWLTYYSNKDSPNNQIWAIRPDGSGRRQLTERGNNTEPRWRPDGHRLRTSLGIYDFSEGLIGESFGPGRSPRRVRIEDNASWSRERGPDRPGGQLIAQTPGGRLVQTPDGGGAITVSSEEDRSFEPQTVRDANGNPYRARFQIGSRWLDDHRLIFWDLDSERAYLWDVDSQKATEIQRIQEPGEFVFSGDGGTLFRLRVVSKSDIWLIELDPESIK